MSYQIMMVTLPNHHHDYHCPFAFSWVVVFYYELISLNCFETKGRLPFQDSGAKPCGTGRLARGLASPCSRCLVRLVDNSELTLIRIIW